MADSLTSGGLLSLAGECGPAFDMRLLSVIVLPVPSGKDSTITRRKTQPNQKKSDISNGLSVCVGTLRTVA
ncbi:hypothetical protein [Nguyenibacter vanlangensis]|uniref:Uncharacterized protein n=1 Tax=Nguyenibacter vanlangensis TaxID=1216886 RepID=A0A7Y7IWV7_9PROT|nr:hypothetical protein [Nguyenibacter vanlangensis]NVN11853.1 hypothetical protein [Nguyenibacter vanlangensis]